MKQKKYKKLKGINKKNCGKLLLKLGFKEQGEPYNFSKWVGEKRIHIRIGRSGFEAHIDKH